MCTHVVVQGPVRRSMRIAITMLLSLVSVAFAFSPYAYGSATSSSTLVTSDYEIGANDFPISDRDFRAGGATVAYNSINHEYLVVFSRDATGERDFEIFGQRIDAATGEEIGEDDFQISRTGPDGDMSWGASFPNIVYNPAKNEYLVSWIGGYVVRPSPIFFPNDLGIYGQRIDAATGEEIGEDDFRIDQELAEPDYYDPYGLKLSYNSTDNSYLAVWIGNPGERFIYNLTGQRFDADGLLVGETDFVIERSVDPETPDVVYNPIENEFLVVWEDTKNFPSQSGRELEIFGQRLDAATGEEVGATSFRISDMGPDGNSGYVSSDPNLAYNSTNHEYLVTWWGNDTAIGDYGTYTQRLDAATGEEVGENDFRIGGNNPSNHAVIYNDQDNEYLLTWSGIFGQRLDGATGEEIGINRFRISDPPSEEFDSSSDPEIAYNGQSNEYLVTWLEYDTFSDDHILGQRLAVRDTPVCDPNEDLWGKVRGVRWVEIGNRSDTCSYDVGGAIYIIPSGDPYDPDIDSQQWFDDVTAELGPGESRILQMDMPSCEAIQVDAFWGEPLRSLDGQRYGERLLAAARFVTGGECGTITSNFSGPYPAPES